LCLWWLTHIFHSVFVISIYFVHFVILPDLLKIMKTTPFHKSIIPILLLLIYLLQASPPYIVQLHLPDIPPTPYPSEKELLHKLTRDDGFCSKAAGHDRAELAPFCTYMVPNHQPHYSPQPASTCPWKFYLGRGEISESFSHPVVIGAVEGGKDKLKNFMNTAKQVEKDGSKARIGSKWEHQWDTISVCCYEKGNDYSQEGRGLNPVITLSCSCLTLPQQAILHFCFFFTPRTCLSDG